MQDLKVRNPALYAHLEPGYRKLQSRYVTAIATGSSLFAVSAASFIGGGIVNRYNEFRGNSNKLQLKFGMGVMPGGVTLTLSSRF